MATTFRFASFCALVSLFAACGGDDGDVLDGGVDGAPPVGDAAPPGDVVTAGDALPPGCTSVTELPAAVETSVTVGPGCVIAHQVAIRNSAVLTVQPGTKVLMKSGGYFDIGSFTGGGALVAVGTAAAPITFTSAAATPQAGDWQCLFFGTGSTDSELSFVNLSHGGALCKVDGSGDNLATVIIRGGIRGFSNSAVTDSLSHGIKIENKAGVRAFANNTFARNGAGGEPSLWVAANEVVTLKTPNTFMDPDDYIRVDSTFSAGTSGTWLAQTVPLRATSLAINDMAQITFAAGLKLQMAGGTIEVFRGNLVSEGTPEAPVLITSGNPNPMPGDWGCIWYSSVQGTPALRNTVIEYAGSGMGCSGANYKMAVVLQDSVQIMGTTIRKIAGGGIRSGAACEVVLPWCAGVTFQELMTEALQCGPGGNMSLNCPP